MHIGKPILSFKVEVNYYYYSLSHHNCTAELEKRLITAPVFLFLSDISALNVFHSDMEGAKREEKGEKKCRRRKDEKK